MIMTVGVDSGSLQAMSAGLVWHQDKNYYHYFSFFWPQYSIPRKRNTEYKKSTKIKLQ